MSSTPFVRVVGYALVACLSAVAALWALPAVAADTTVEVRDNSYAPQQIEVRSGDVVTWTWVGTNRHSVTSHQDTPPLLQFDSDGDCADADGQRVNCRSKGDADYQDFTWLVPVVDQQTTVTYLCKLHGGQGMTATVVVKPPVEDSASPSPSPSPTPEPSSSPSQGSSDTTEEKSSPSPTAESSPTKTTQDQQAEQPADDTEPSEEPQPEPTRGTADDPGISFGSPEPIDPEPLPTILPSVAPSADDTTTTAAMPDLEEFPEARTPDPGESEEPGVVAIDDPGGGIPPRTLWLGIGSASILAAAGAFAKFVLFGAPWV
ncbi:MAG: plastocyanin/azurin family copper-binding protein [Nitriliruptorales bacterium]|nr:plastocyanin/azurin family copper-binding protein [Nitriliruptorales bacterium]